MPRHGPPRLRKSPISAPPREISATLATYRVSTAPSGAASVSFRDHFEFHRELAQRRARGFAPRRWNFRP
jgi:hypothetical protein